MAVTRCRVGRRWGGNEFDEEPAVLPVVRVSYSFVSITAEGQDSREKDSTLNRTIHAYRL